MKKVLFFGEGVTTAHVIRPLVLANKIKKKGIEIEIATPARHHHFLQSASYKLHDLHSIDYETFEKRTLSLRFPYTEDDLNAYIAEDLDLIKKVKPDLVIGDLRLSLAISARIAGVKYAGITNFQWSPYADLVWPLPSLRGVPELLINPIRKPLAKFIKTIADKKIARFFEKLALQHGVKRSCSGVGDVYTDADYVLFSDIDSIAPHTGKIPSNMYFIGPLNWVPETNMPPWWNDVPEDKPVISIMLGSSGRKELSPIIANVLSELPVTILAAIPEEMSSKITGDNIYHCPFLPGYQANERSDLMITNGGSMTSYQSCSLGVSFLAICNNLDQYLCMEVFKDHGICEHLRAQSLSVRDVVSFSKTLLEGAQYKQNALSFSRKLKAWKTDEIIESFLKDTSMIT